MRRFLSLAIVLCVCPHGSAWNAKGHMVIARLVWLKLNAEQRGKAVEILKKHPHYDEFLADGRPENIPEDEWVFLRSATWSD